MWTNHSRVEKALLKNRSLIVIIENVLLCMFEMYRIVHFDRSYVIVYECFFLLNFSSLCWMWKVKSCYSWCGFSMENFIFPLARDNFGITLSDISNWHPFLFVSWKHSFRFFFYLEKWQLSIFLSFIVVVVVIVVRSISHSVFNFRLQRIRIW